MTPPSYPNMADGQTIALQAVAWIVADTDRADRFLALTGLDADQLRHRISEPPVLCGALDFLLGHEPDLIACARDIGAPPEAIAAAREGLA